MGSIFPSAKSFTSSLVTFIFTFSFVSSVCITNVILESALAISFISSIPESDFAQLPNIALLRVFLSLFKAEILRGISLLIVIVIMTSSASSSNSILEISPNMPKSIGHSLLAASILVCNSFLDESQELKTKDANNKNVAKRNCLIHFNPNLCRAQLLNDLFVYECPKLNVTHP